MFEGMDIGDWASLGSVLALLAGLVAYLKKSGRSEQVAETNDEHLGTRLDSHGVSIQELRECTDNLVVLSARHEERHDAHNRKFDEHETDIENLRKRIDDTVNRLTKGR